MLNDEAIIGFILKCRLKMLEMKLNCIEAPPR